MGNNKAVSLLIFLIIVLITTLILEGNKKQYNESVIFELQQKNKELTEINNKLKDSLTYNAKYKLNLFLKIDSINKEVTLRNNRIVLLTKELSNIKGRYNHLTTDSVLLLIIKRYEKDNFSTSTNK
ncbi:MAG: hypothetical protein ACK53T_01385 [Planctomycetota bacterium]|jgi:predicted nucleic acid-binding protein